MTRTPKASYKLVGVHLEDLADGRVVAPGDTIVLDQHQADEPHNQRLLQEGQLIPVDDKKREE